jgi:pilus assembly protein CpaF
VRLPGGVALPGAANIRAGRFGRIHPGAADSTRPPDITGKIKLHVITAPMPGSSGPKEYNAMSRLSQGLSRLNNNSKPVFAMPGGLGAGGQNKSFEDLKRHIHGKLVEKLDFSRVKDLQSDALRKDIRRVIEHLCDTENPLLNRMERERLIDEILDETLGFGPLEALLKDPTISDIMVNGPHTVYIERRGKLEKSEIKFRDNEHLLQIIDRIVSKVGRRVDETSPMVDARLPDGSRVNAIIPPLALDGPTVSIRRFGATPLKLEDLLNYKAFSPEMAMLMEACIKARLNVLISGGTGCGKTTLLNTLSSFIPNDERIITIEDAAELQLQQEHVVRLETRPPNIEGKGAVTTRDLVRNALRMRPERIIIGECRGSEALDMLQAMNTGHSGSMTTLHANAPREGLSRLETMIMMGGFELPVKAMRQQIASAVDIIIQANRLQGGPRKVTYITEVLNMEQDVIIMQDIFRYRQLGIDQNGRAYGQFEATGVRPTFVPRLEQKGIKLPSNLFQERVLMRD